jgi:uncharacterized protein YndB with AHSA1/START domain
VAVEDLVMVPQGRHAAAATGRNTARWLFLCLMLVAMAAGEPLASADATQNVTVTDKSGVYAVTASFRVSESPEAVMAVLTDYDRIPRFMPDVEVSRVLERTHDGAVVEQRAVSRFMMFSKAVHLVLEVHELPHAIRFRDRCRGSFATYQGGWTLSRHEGMTVVDYHLTAKPSFDVPAFVLKRLLKRDSAQLIDRIKAEITARENGRK